MTLGWPFSTGFDAGYRLRVLVVEDEPMIAWMLEAEIQGLGHEVVGIAATASQALELARATQPDMAIMDIRLADGSDGIEAALRLRDDLGIPSVFVSGNADEATRTRAVAAAPLGFIVKPVNLVQLGEILAERYRAVLTAPAGRKG
jgi:CheY-like chemotaxis protein